MRRPGTLPAANTHPTSVVVGSQQRTGPTGLFCTNQQTTVSELTSNGGASLRTNHHSSHSLRRAHQSQSPAPALPARGDSCNSERHQQTNSSRSQNGMIPSHPPPPPRHSPPCPQSSYPTLPINGHAVPHHYRHYRGDRERSRDRSLSRDREIVAASHRDKHRGDTMELEVHDDDSSSGIGTYRA